MEPLNKLIFGLHAETSQKRACHLAEEDFDHVEPRRVLGSEDELENAPVDLPTIS